MVVVERLTDCRCRATSMARNSPAAVILLGGTVIYNAILIENKWASRDDSHICSRVAPPPLYSHTTSLKLQDALLNRPSLCFFKTTTPSATCSRVTPPEPPSRCTAPCMPGIRPTKPTLQVLPIHVERSRWQAPPLHVLSVDLTLPLGQRFHEPPGSMAVGESTSSIYPPQDGSRPPLSVSDEWPQRCIACRKPRLRLEHQILFPLEAAK